MVGLWEPMLLAPEISDGTSLINYFEKPKEYGGEQNQKKKKKNLHLLIKVS